MDLLKARVGPRTREAAARLLFFVACACAAVVIAAPVAAVHAVERVQFDDRLGTFPVNVSLCHNGRSTLDTGIFGKVFWDETGAYGFGAYARSTGTPEAGGTLASYVDPDFIQANVAFVDDPDVVVDAYRAKFTDGLRDHIVLHELIAGIIGGFLLALIVPRSAFRPRTRRRALAVAAVILVSATAVSAGVAAQLFRDWSCNQPVTGDLAMPGVERLSFASAATLEVAKQVQPLIEKNTARIEARADQYETAAKSSFDEQLALHLDTLIPRDGETIVLAEADPQGSFVGTAVRTSLYEDLVAALGDAAISLRTISGDVSSNGTIAEVAYIADEAAVGGEIPVAAVGGDHDSEATWEQMTDSGITIPDLTTEEVGGLRVSGANDREHKSLFGGLVSNPSGVSEHELGAQLRAVIDDEPRIVILHQPDAVAGYLGMDSLDAVRAINGSRTTPYDDGIPDQVPGTVNVGHLHEFDGPWVIWNTGSEKVTWTVVDQLGTSGGVENSPTFNRFSTPVSVPLKPLTVRLQYFNVDTGLQTGYVSVTCDPAANCAISDRVDVGLAGGVAVPAE